MFSSYKVSTTSPTSCKMFNILSEPIQSVWVQPVCINFCTRSVSDSCTHLFDPSTFKWISSYLLNWYDLYGRIKPMAAGYGDVPSLPLSLSCLSFNLIKGVWVNEPSNACPPMLLLHTCTVWRWLLALSWFIGTSSGFWMISLYD